MAKNFDVAQSDLAHLPQSQKWSTSHLLLFGNEEYTINTLHQVFNGTPDKKTLQEDAASIASPAGTIDPGYSLHFSELNATEYEGGTVKIADSTSNFPISKTIAAALVTINPGAMREMQ